VRFIDVFLCLITVTAADMYWLNVKRC